MEKWFWNLLLAIDQLANVLFSPLLNLMVRQGGALYGDPDETISSVSGKNFRDGTCLGCTWLCRLLHLVDRNHCERSIETDEGKPPAKV